MRSGFGRVRGAAGSGMAAAILALSLMPLGAAPSAQAQSTPQDSAAKAKGPKVAGCDPKSRSSNEIGGSGPIDLCVATAVEAWYHTTPGSGLPPDVPLSELPEESQYPKHTLHVGQRVGEEESRTYLTFDLSAIPLTAEITEALVYLPLDEDGGTQEPRLASFKACLVNEPPEKSKQGSFEQPPEAECSKTLSSAPATYNKKPRPHFELELAQLSELITPSVGIALMPTKTETQRTKTWHLAFYSRKNKDKDAEPISTLITYQEASPPTFGGLPPPSSGGDSGPSSSSFDAGGGFAAPPTSGAGAPPGTIDSVLGNEADDPVDAGGGQIVAAQPVAIRIDPRAYLVKWLVPLALLFGIVFWSFVLNREIKLPRR